MTKPQLPTYSKANKIGWLATEDTYRMICMVFNRTPKKFPPNATRIEMLPDGSEQFRDVNYEIVKETK